MQRRALLKWVTGSIGALVSATVVAPVVGLIGHPLWRRVQSGGEEPLPVADLDRLPHGVPVRATVVAPVRRDAWAKFERVALGAVWLVRSGDAVSALSTTCPHAGCFVDFESAKRGFTCPCHGSAFDLGGRCVAGPSPRPMDSLETVVKNGKVLVRFQRFRQARPTKETI